MMMFVSVGVGCVIFWRWFSFGIWKDTTNNTNKCHSKVKTKWFSFVCFTHKNGCLLVLILLISISPKANEALRKIGKNQPKTKKTAVWRAAMVRRWSWIGSFIVDGMRCSDHIILLYVVVVVAGTTRPFVEWSSYCTVWFIKWRQKKQPNSR